MSPWTALLESLHSALVDELNERFPKQKPVLGLPVRSAGFQLPPKASPPVFVCEVFLGQSQGLAFLSLSPELSRKLGVDTSALWKILMKRAGGEFMRRGIQPKLGGERELQTAALPAVGHQPTRVVWIPMEVNGAGCALGMGV